MSRLLRVLIIEDSEANAALVLRYLRHAGYQLKTQRIETITQMKAALDRQLWDVILANDQLPKFNSSEALALLLDKELDIPLIMIADVMNEERAIAAMKAGANDYLSRNDLSHLVLSIERELREATGRRDRRNSEAALSASERLLRAVFDGALDAMVIVDDQGKFVAVNPAASHLFGLSEPQLLSCSLIDFLESGTDFERVWHNFQDKRQTIGEVRILRPDGTLRDVEYSSTANFVNGLHLSVFHDITQRKRTEEQLLYHAFYDGLTGLPNRNMFLDSLKRLIKHGKRRHPSLFAVLFLDLDRFGVVKYSFGHLFSDQLLIATAHRLVGCLRSTDTIARVGADEFALLLADIANEEEAVAVAEQIHGQLMLPFKLNECEVFTTASIGIAIGSYGSTLKQPGYERPEDFLRAADTAKQHAKASGGARTIVFDIPMHQQALAVLQLETDLRRAIFAPEHFRHHSEETLFNLPQLFYLKEQFCLHYQPIVSLVSGQIVGFEALIRWQHPERGFISPAQFIPVAEETGLVIPLGKWVLCEACRQLRQWQQFFPFDMPITMSVNLSGIQFAQAGLLSQIDEILEFYGVEGQFLKLEITESLIVEPTESVTTLLEQLRNRKIQLCIDDFGTGYSSLSRLCGLPIDTLKIDRAFVSGINSQTGSREIVKTILALAENLGMDTIAEGVETVEQLSQLRSLKCDYGQGYLFSKPLDAEAATSLLFSKPHW